MSNPEATGEPPRLVPLHGTFNFRDLGGYRTNGGRTRWGRLYRSDALLHLDDHDIATLTELGLATVVDLRSSLEISGSGQGPLASTNIRYMQRSLIERDAGESRGAPAPPGAELAERYLFYVDVSRKTFAGLVELIAQEDNLPLVFHCAAGKDRTGVVAALVLSLLGVEREDIVADYLATGAGLAAIVARLAEDPVHRKLMDFLPPSYYQIEARTMEAFLDGFADRYGDAYGWARQAGIPDSVLDRLQASLVEPA